LAYNILPGTRPQQERNTYTTRLKTQPPGRPTALYRQTDYSGFPRLPSSPYVTMAAIRFPTLLLVVAAAFVAAASGGVRTTMAAPAPSDVCDPFLPCSESGECPDLRGEPRVCINRDRCNPSVCSIDPVTCGTLNCTRDCGGTGRCVRAHAPVLPHTARRGDGGVTAPTA